MQKSAGKLIGTVIDNFEIQELIGQGGMGIVYRAYHPALQLSAAVKVMRPEFASQAGFYERFLQEARTIARLEHPNIVDVINFGRYENSYYLMMDFIQGPSMRQIIRERQGPLNLWDSVQIAWQIADVLVYSHSYGVLHRDLKPDNILLTHSVRPNRPYRVIVTDFGLVKLGQGSLLETQEGISLGTPAYMSPEQCRGEEVDGRTDVYALGVLLYEAVTGKRPYPIRSLFDAAKYHASGKLIAPRALNSAIPVKLDELIRRMIAPNLGQRIGSAAEATDELQECLIELHKDIDGQEFPSDLVARVVSESPLPATPESPAEGSTTPTLAPEKEKAAEAPPEVEEGPDEFFVQVAYMGDWEDRVLPLGDKPAIVGRLAESDIVLDRPGQRFVSRRHCEILVRDNRVLIRDLGSSNGTLLGEDALKHNVFRVWSPGVSVTLGPFQLALRTGKELSQVPSPPAQDFDAASPPTAITKIHGNMRLVCPDAVPSRLPLSKDHPIVIGRAMDCDMVLDHPQVSKHHCRIQVGNEGVEVVDLRSTNGTVMNGQRLPPHVAVAWKEAPVVMLGPFTLNLEKKGQ
jgi:serine/threonine protein kinase/pSer/pThr/pTyr-binding forkhead associated (FHA) protein